MLTCARKWLLRMIRWPFPNIPVSGTPLALQLLFQFIEEAPVRTLGNELLGTALYYPGLVQAQGVEAHRILGVILAPHIVGEFLQDPQGIVVWTLLPSHAWAQHLTIASQALLP